MRKPTDPSRAVAVKPVIERDPAVSRKKNRRFAFPATTKGFPDAKAASAELQSSQTRTANVSLFSQLMTKADATTERPRTVQSQPARPVDEDSERQSISAENVARLSQMSDRETEEARLEVISRFDPTVLEGLMKAKGSKTKKEKKKTVSFAENTEKTAPVDLGWIKSEQDLKGALDKLPTHEKQKVRWMLEDDAEQQEENGGDGSNGPANGTDDAKEVRFDLAGNFITDASAEFKNELYHHGGPNVPGYTIDELVHLARSTVANQRVIALKALAGLFSKRAENLSNYSKISMQQDEALITLRLGLDQENATSLPQSIEALHAYLLPPAKFENEREVVLGLGMGHMQWGVTPRAQGSPTTPPAPAREIPMDPQEEETEDADEENRLNDRELAEASPVRFLIRTGFVQRAAFLLSQRQSVIPSTAKARLLEITIFVIRARPSTATQQFSELNRLVQGIFEWDKLQKETNDEELRNQRIVTQRCVSLVLCVINAGSESARLASESWMPVLLNWFRTTTAGFKTLKLILCCLRSCLVHGLLTGIVQESLYLIEGRMEDILDGIQTGIQQDRRDELDFMCVGFDAVAFYCTNVAKHGTEEERKRVHEKLQSFAGFATQLAARLFGILGTRCCSAAVRFLGEYVRLLHQSGMETEPDWDIGSIVSPSRNRQNAGDNVDSPQEAIDSSMMAVIIFTGHACYLEEDTEWPSEAEATRWDAIRSCASALQSLSAISPQIAETIVESSTVVEDLWVRASAPVDSKRRSGTKPPQSPLLGYILLARDDAFTKTLGLMATVSMYLQSRPSCNELRVMLAEHVSGRAAYGPVGNESQTAMIISALLTPAFRLFATSRQTMEARHVLLSKFRGFLSLNSATDSSLIVCRKDQATQLWIRAGKAWPALPLFTGAADLDNRVAHAALDLAYGLRDYMGQSMYGALCNFCIGASRDVLFSQQVTLIACKLWDSAPKITATEFITFIGGKERTRQLATELAQRFVEDCFGHPLLGRCLSLLIHPVIPVPVRAGAWRVLDRGRGLRALVSYESPEMKWPTEGDEDEEMLELFVASIEMESLQPDCWLFDCVKARLSTLFAKKNKWAAKRLWERLSQTQPTIVQQHFPSISG